MFLVHSTNKGVCEELYINKKNKPRRKMGKGYVKKILKEEMQVAKNILDA